MHRHPHTYTQSASRAAEMALQIEVEKQRAAEALNARDAVVQRLSDAYISIRQKTSIIEELRKGNMQVLHDLPKSGASTPTLTTIQSSISPWMSKTPVPQELEKVSICYCFCARSC